MPFHVASSDATMLANRASSLGVDPGVVSAVRTASAESGTSFDVMLTSAVMESGLNPTAKASGSSASGLFQFTEQTWLDTLRQNGAAHGLGAEAAAVVRQGNRLTVSDPTLRQKILDLRNDPKAASAMAGDHLRDIAGNLGTTIGRAPDAAEIYLGHFLGTGGAAQMLQAQQATPDRPAAGLMPDAAAANRAMFYGSNGQPFSVSQFMQHLRGRVEHAYATLGTTMPAAGDGTTMVAAAAPAGGVATTSVGAAGKPSTTPQRLMMANLAEIVAQIDRGNTQGARHADRKHQVELPEGLFAALRPGTT